jgi:hypothetical protein
VAGLAALIKERLELDAELVVGRKGQFDVVADGDLIASRGGNWFTRQFGAGYPDFDEVVALVSKKL